MKTEKWLVLQNFNAYFSNTPNWQRNYAINVQYAKTNKRFQTADHLNETELQQNASPYQHKSSHQNSYSNLQAAYCFKNTEEADLKEANGKTQN